MPTYEGFADALLSWHDANARDLPWRGETDPYRIWLSEIMLQQTRTETVKGYYSRFLRLFPDVFALARADEDAVLKAWEGLGYYSRARNLLAAAKLVAFEINGRFPQTEEALLRLPGVGKYAAGAIASIAFGIKAPAIDGNQIRALARVMGLRDGPVSADSLRTRALMLMPDTRCGDYNQALMGLGALVCVPVSPRCDACPVAAYCDARRAGDTALLPVRRDKPLKSVERRGIAVVLCGGGVLLRRRGEGLLRGLWEFPGFENAMGEAAINACLAELGFDARPYRHLGFARHVFTHLIWEMEGAAFVSKNAPSGFVFADIARLDALAMPTALQKYRADARALLKEGIVP